MKFQNAKENVRFVPLFLWHFSCRNTVWGYDALGNIISATTYDYSLEVTLQNEKEVVTYNYGADTDAGWNKLLTSIVTEKYTGNEVTSTVTETIDYDAIGNPISYRGATMGWFGRQLTSYFKNGTTITNTYDVEGIRGSKTVNGSKTTYQYIDGQLQYEKRGDSSKLISVYANRDAQRPVKSSSAGIYINIVDFTLDISGGMDDIGILGS